MIFPNHPAIKGYPHLWKPPRYIFYVYGLYIHYRIGWWLHVTNSCVCALPDADLMVLLSLLLRFYQIRSQIFSPFFSQFDWLTSTHVDMSEIGWLSLRTALKTWLVKQPFWMEKPPELLRGHTQFWHQILQFGRSCLGLVGSKEVKEHRVQQAIF